MKDVQAIDRSYAEIDLKQLRENYRIYKATLPQDMEVMAVVKADAYGHGDVRVARCLESIGVHLFAVSNVREAIGLREGGVKGEILVLGYTPVELSEWLYRYDITQALVSEEYAAALAAATSHKIKCQFAIDTGMNRIGLDAEAPAACEAAIRRYAEVFALNGIFTHLCVADGEGAEDVAFTERQLQLFEGVVHAVADMKLQYCHCMNSAGGLFYSKRVPYHGDLARLGIVLYGLKPDFSNTLPEGIRPVLAWKTVVAMVKTIKAGESVGYGRTYTAQRDVRVATLPTGYADGYNRLLSGKGHVLIHGKKAPIIGRVCMDQMTVDVTDIPEVVLGDEVVLLGECGKERITADEMGKMLGTIGYEIVCDISKRVERRYLEK